MGDLTLEFTDHTGTDATLEDGAHANYASLLLHDRSDGESACLMLNEQRVHMVITTLLQSRAGRTYVMPNIEDYTDEQLESFMKQRKSKKIDKAKEALTEALKAAYEAGVPYDDILDTAKNF